LIPRNCALESRPFRVEETPFFDAIYANPFTSHH
jgi:hypothetical protein